MPASQASLGLLIPVNVNAITLVLSAMQINTGINSDANASVTPVTLWVLLAILQLNILIPIHVNVNVWIRQKHLLTILTLISTLTNALGNVFQLLHVNLINIGMTANANVFVYRNLAPIWRSGIQLNANVHAVQLCVLMEQFGTKIVANVFVPL